MVTNTDINRLTSVKSDTIEALERAKARFDALTIVVSLMEEGVVNNWHHKNVIGILEEGSEICGKEIRNLKGNGKRPKQGRKKGPKL